MNLLGSTGSLPWIRQARLHRNSYFPLVSGWIRGSRTWIRQGSAWKTSIFFSYILGANMKLNLPLSDSDRGKLQVHIRFEHLQSSSEEGRRRGSAFRTCFGFKRVMGALGRPFHWPRLFNTKRAYHINQEGSFFWPLHWSMDFQGLAPPM